MELDDRIDDQLCCRDADWLLVQNDYKILVLVTLNLSKQDRRKSISMD